MRSAKTTTVDFVAKGASPDEWQIVLVEEGPWAPPLDVQLHRLQDRLYGAIDAALDGQLAETFPESKGKRIIIQLDAYNLPQDEVQHFFDQFSKGIALIPDYQRALTCNPFVRELAFKVTFESVS